MPNHRMRTAGAAAIMTSALALPAPTLADTVPLVNFKVGIGSWEPGLEGDIASEGGDNFDTEDELGFDDTSGMTLEAAFEHPVPLLPNIKLRRAGVDDSANGTVSTDRTFSNVDFIASEEVRSEYELTMTDATLYWSPLDNWISLDFGITARHADLEVQIDRRDGSESAKEDGSAIIPMGYLAARADLPLTGVYAAGQLDAVSAGDNSIQDYSVGLGWEASQLFGIEVGYRELSLDVEDADDVEADIDLGGPYIQGSLRF